MFKDGVGFDSSKLLKSVRGPIRRILRLIAGALRVR